MSCIAWQIWTKKGGRYERPQGWKRLILIRMEAFPGRNPLGKKGQASFRQIVLEEKQELYVI